MTDQKNLRRLKKEEEVLRKVLQKYKDGLNALQIEELSLKYELNLSRSLEINSRNNSVLPDIGDFHTASPLEPGHLEDAAADRKLVSLMASSLEATHLIQRMLSDSEVYPKEEQIDV